MQLVFATNNANKLREAQQILPNYKIISLEDAGIHEELPETHETILENSKENGTGGWLLLFYGISQLAAETMWMENPSCSTSSWLSRVTRVKLLQCSLLAAFSNPFSSRRRIFGLLMSYET